METSRWGVLEQSRPTTVGLSMSPGGSGSSAMPAGLREQLLGVLTKRSSVLDDKDSGIKKKTTPLSSKEPTFASFQSPISKRKSPKTPQLSSPVGSS